MNWRAIRALMRKDLLAVRRSPIVLLPLIIVPIILIVVIPAGLGLAARLLPDALANETSDLQGFWSRCRHPFGTKWLA